MQLGSELINLITLSYQTKNLIGHDVSGDLQEILSDDIPEPLGKAVVTTIHHGCLFESLFNYW